MCFLPVVAVNPKHFDIFFIQIVSVPARNLVEFFGIVSHFARFLHLEFDFQVMHYFTLFFFFLSGDLKADNLTFGASDVESNLCL